MRPDYSVANLGSPHVPLIDGLYTPTRVVTAMPAVPLMRHLAKESQSCHSHV